MKKSVLAITMIASALSANAQKGIQDSKFTDNWSVGVQAGVYEPTIGQNIIGDMRPAFNLDIQKQITPVFGVGLNYMMGVNPNNTNQKTMMFFEKAPKTGIDISNLGVNGLVNLSNLFCGYKGEPRMFETVLRAGAGWGYVMGDCYPQNYGSAAYNTVTANFGVDFNFNVSDAWAINIKPGINYWGVEDGLDVRCSNIQLLAGVTYKFKNSNGTHHFVPVVQKYSDAQIDEMNARINALRGEVAARNKSIADLQNALNAERSKNKNVTNHLIPVVIFTVGSSVIEESQKPSISMIATYMKNHPNSHVTIYGYASPEGDANFNQRLSTARAEAVKKELTYNYGIKPERLSTKGMGVTDKLFEERDWNRVAIFVDDSEQK